MNNIWGLGLGQANEGVLILGWCDRFAWKAEISLDGTPGSAEWSFHPPSKVGRFKTLHSYAESVFSPGAKPKLTGVWSSCSWIRADRRVWCACAQPPAILVERRFSPELNSHFWMHLANRRQANLDWSVQRSTFSWGMFQQWVWRWQNVGLAECSWVTHVGPASGLVCRKKRTLFGVACPPQLAKAHITSTSCKPIQDSPNMGGVTSSDALYVWAWAHLWIAPDLRVSHTNGVLLYAFGQPLRLVRIPSRTYVHCYVTGASLCDHIYWDSSTPSLPNCPALSQ